MPSLVPITPAIATTNFHVVLYAVVCILQAVKSRRPALVEDWPSVVIPRHSKSDRLWLFPNWFRPSGGCGGVDFLDGQLIVALRPSIERADDQLVRIAALQPHRDPDL